MGRAALDGDRLLADGDRTDHARCARVTLWTRRSGGACRPGRELPGGEVTPLQRAFLTFAPVTALFASFGLVTALFFSCAGADAAVRERGDRGETRAAQGDEQRETRDDHRGRGPPPEERAHWYLHDGRFRPTVPTPPGPRSQP